MKNRKAFENFYKANYKNALGYTIKRRLPKEYAEDLVQEAFLEVWEKYDEDYIKNPKLFFKLLDFRIANAKNDFKRRVEMGANLKTRYPPRIEK